MIQISLISIILFICILYGFHKILESKDLYGKFFGGLIAGISTILFFLALFGAIGVTI